MKKRNRVLLSFGLICLTACSEDTNDNKQTGPKSHSENSEDIGAVNLHGEALTCQFKGMGIPDTKEFSVLGQTIGANLGLAPAFGLVGASFEIFQKNKTKINILDGISAAGAGWQFSAIAQTMDDDKNFVHVFNQGAGNMDQQWGVRAPFKITDKSRLQQIRPIKYFSDHAHEVGYVDNNGVFHKDGPNFAKRLNHSPCSIRSEDVSQSVSFFTGKVTLDARQVKVTGDKQFRDWKHSTISVIQHKTEISPIPSIKKPKLRYLKIEHGLYLDKWVAARHDLRIYFIGMRPTGSWVKGPISPHWDKHFMDVKEDPLVYAQADVVNELPKKEQNRHPRAYSCGDWLEQDRCQVGTDDLSIALLLWKYDDGEQVGMAVHRSNFEDFNVFLARTLSHRCTSPKAMDAMVNWKMNGGPTLQQLKEYHDCGNLEFHSFIKGRDDLELVSEDKDLLYKKGSYELSYALGSFRELVQFTEDKLKVRIDVDKNGMMSVKKK